MSTVAIPGAEPFPADEPAETIDDGRPRFWGLSLLVDPLVVGFLLIIAIAAVTYLPGQAISIESNDQLDSMIPAHAAAPPVWESIFNPNAELRAVSGLSLNHLAFSEFDATRVIFSIFPSYTEVGAFFLIMIVALYASYVVVMQAIGGRLGGTNLVPVPDRAAIALGAAFLALLPHSMATLGTLVALNLYVAALFLAGGQASRGKLLLLVALSAFFGDIAYGGYLFLGAGLVLSTGFALFTGKWKPALCAVIALVITSIADYRTFVGLFFGEPSHRSTWLDGAYTGLDRLTDPAYWGNAFKEMTAMLFGKPIHYHYQWNTGNMLLILVLGGLVAGFALQGAAALSRRRKFALQAGTLSSLALVACLLLTCLIVVFAYGVLSANIIPIAAWLHLTLQLERIIVFLPLLGATAVTFATSVAFRALAWPVLRSAILGLIVTVLAVTIHTPLQRKLANEYHFFFTAGTNPYVPNYTVGTVYARGTFSALKDLLGDGWRNERVMSIGMDPMIATYNGFWAFDGYYYQYPKAWQLAFRKVVAPTLEKMPSQAGLYDGWGSRFGASIVDSKDGFIYAPIDACAFAALGGTLVISQYPMMKISESHLTPFKQVGALNDGLLSKIFLYRPDQTCPAPAQPSAPR